MLKRLVDKDWKVSNRDAVANSEKRSEKEGLSS